MPANENRLYTKPESHYVLNDAGLELHAMIEEIMRELRRPVVQTKKIVLNLVILSTMIAIPAVTALPWMLLYDTAQSIILAIGSFLGICFLIFLVVIAHQEQKAHAKIVEQIAVILYGNPRFMNEFCDVAGYLHSQPAFCEAMACARKRLKDQAEEQ